jgi:fucose 4-O-acetylase-like acetyltransferase
MIRLPWHIETAISMLVWYLIGIFFKERKKEIIKVLYRFNQCSLIRFVGVFLLISIGVFCAFLNTTTVGVRNDNYGNLIIYYFGAMFSIAGFIWMSTIIGKNRMCEYIGRHSLVILGLHKFPILVFQELISPTKKLLNSPNSFYGILCGMLISVVAIGFSMVCGLFIERVCPWVLGKQNTSS